jgi:hypothetical protein
LGTFLLVKGVPFISQGQMTKGPIPAPNGKDDQIGSRRLASWYRKFGFRGDALLCRTPETFRPPIGPS